MNLKSLKTLEYNKITAMLSDFASTDQGKKLCLNLVPSTDMREITLTQCETADALKILWYNGRISFGGVRDISSSIKRLETGGCLTAEELLAISSTLDVALRIKNFLRDYYNKNDKIDNAGHDNDTDSHDPYIDSLQERFELISPLSPLNNEIKRCIISVDEIADDATPELRSVRRSIANASEKIRNQLNSMLNSQTMRTYLQDFVITQRDDRYCLPVRAEHRSRVPGMIHDRSSSGSTLFIEPMAVVALNNEIKTYRLREKCEIERVLAMLSDNAAQYAVELSNDFNVLTELDFIFAKASFAKEFKCSMPLFNIEGRINIKEARHPLLNQAAVVPVDIRLGDTFDQLIITGPNTGGKTVLLKTVGLFTLMGQAGLHIPAFDNSSLAIFNEVYADIGDEQSIEQNLSTFSSHMKNIVNIIECADESSLVLFDEICAGTDPLEGAALAISILTFLHNMKVRTVATTHYSELKSFALREAGIENASCEFSVETLSPTYRLLIGVPGKSNAFAISGKLGLPQFIIDNAMKTLDADARSFEDLLSELENNRNALERERAELSSELEKTERLKADLEKKLQKADDGTQRIISEAMAKADDILQEAKSFADETIRNINKSGISVKELENERHRIRNKISEYSSKKEAATEKLHGTHSPKDFHIGDTVMVLSLNLKGTVSSLPDNKGDMYVTMGILRSLVNIKDLRIIEEESGSELRERYKNPGNTSKRSVSNRSTSSRNASTENTFPKNVFGESVFSENVRMSKIYTISDEINIIGMTTDEGVSALDKYLDDAYLAHIHAVRIIHGRGTGALKNAVHSYLKRLKYVKDFRPGAFGEGGDGVTVVEFK